MLGKTQHDHTLERANDNVVLHHCVSVILNYLMMCADVFTMFHVKRRLTRLRIKEKAVGDIASQLLSYLAFDDLILCNTIRRT